MSPVVAVQVAPATAGDRRELEALLRACSQALPVGSCQLEANAGGGAPAAEARVTWDDLGNAFVSVQLQGASQQLTRQLTFAHADPELQRWRAAGLTIATIVDELQTQRDAEAEHPEAAGTPVVTAAQAPRNGDKPAATAASTNPTAPLRATPPPPPRRERPNVAPPSSSALEAGVVAALGGDGQTPRGGLYAGALHAMAGMPVLVVARVAYELSTADDPSLSWLELGFGGGSYVPVRSARIEGLGMLQMVRTMAAARSPVTGGTDEAASWLPAAGVLLRGVWPARGSVSGSLGVTGQWVARQVVVTNAGREAARASAYTVGLVAGFRFVF